MGTFRHAERQWHQAWRQGAARELLQATGKFALSKFWLKLWPNVYCCKARDKLTCATLDLLAISKRVLLQAMWQIHVIQVLRLNAKRGTLQATRQCHIVKTISNITDAWKNPWSAMRTNDNWLLAKK